MELDITNEEAIVLWNFLRRYSSEDILGIEDQAEQRVLWNVECMFEKIINNCYTGNWKNALNESLNKLRDTKGTDSIVEREKGRIALWLEPNEIEFLLSQWRQSPADTSNKTLETWGKVAFRCNAALHKAGLKT